MSRVLVLYGTTDGHTAKIASAAAASLRGEGCQVDVINAWGILGSVHAADYDAVLVAASVHEGRFQRPVRQWVRANAAELGRRPSAFVAVCLAVLEQRPEARIEINRIVDRFLGRESWRPSMLRLVAGAVPFTRYGWLKKLVMKRICAKAGGGTDTTRDYEYTDWDDLREFTRTFARHHHLGASEPVPERGMAVVA